VHPAEKLSAAFQQPPADDDCWPHGLKQAENVQRVSGDIAHFLRSIVECFGLELPTSDFGYDEEKTTAARASLVPPSSEIKARFLPAHPQVFQAPQVAIKRVSEGGRQTGECQKNETLARSVATNFRRQLVGRRRDERKLVIRAAPGRRSPPVPSPPWVVCNRYFSKGAACYKTTLAPRLKQLVDVETDTAQIGDGNAMRHRAIGNLRAGQRLESRSP
jgi:hypothetical protein